MNQYNDKNEKHGYWEHYYPNGNINYKGNFFNGIAYGYWECYWDNGDIHYKGKYNNGLKDGYWEEYYTYKDVLTYKEFYL